MLICTLLRGYGVRQKKMGRRRAHFIGLPARKPANPYVTEAAEPQTALGSTSFAGLCT
jgi:hypothetical protein